MSSNIKPWPTVVLLASIVAALFCTGLGNLRAAPQAHVPAAAVAVLPLPTPAPLPNDQAALAHVSQRARVPTERLLLADEFVQAFPLSDCALWRGLVLDRAGAGQPLYEVFIHARGGAPLNSAEVEALWEAERAAYRAQYGDQVLKQVAWQAGVPATRIQIAGDVLVSYPLTGVIFWRVKTLDVEAGAPYHLALGPDGQQVDPATLRRAEFEAHRAR